MVGCGFVPVGAIKRAPSVAAAQFDAPAPPSENRPKERIYLN
jgi:hypothetical protein